MVLTRRRVFSLLPALIATGCNRPGTVATRLRVAVSPRVTNAAIHLAFERGLFREEGLDVSFVEGRNTRDGLALLVGGQADAALFGFTAGLANAVARGSRIRTVAGRDEIQAGCSDQGALYYRRARFPRGLEDLGEWKGSRIALGTENQMTEFYLDVILQSQGLPSAAVQTSRMDVAEAVASATAGHLDIFFGSGRPEFLNGGLPKGLARSDLPVRLLGACQYSYIHFGARLIDGTTEIGAAFLRAYLRGVRRFVAGETPVFLDALAARTHMDPGLVKSGCRGNISLTGEVRMADLERWLAWAISRKYVTQAVTANQIVDLRFQRAAEQGL